MPSIARAVTRAGLVGGAALLAATLVVPSASAASADLSYSCEFGVDEEGGSGSGSAMWDSAIGDDVTVEVGQQVSLDPFTGSITMPDDFRALLRSSELDPISGGGITFTLVDENGEEYDVFFEFGSTPVPAEGPLVLQVQGEGGDIVPEEAGTQTLLAGDFILFIDTGEEGPDAGMFCELNDEGDTAIDAFDVTAAASPTVTPSAEPTATAERPVVVQTDFAGGDRASALPLVLGGGLLAAGGAALVTGRARARATSRRH